MSELTVFLIWVVVGGTVTCWTIAANWWGLCCVYNWLTRAPKKDIDHG